MTLGVFAVGLTLAILGGLLRASFCLGGGSECNGSSPVAPTLGTVLFWLGNGLVVLSPVIPLAIARWTRRRAAPR